MSNAATSLERRLGGTDVEKAVQLQRIAVDDLAIEQVSEVKREIGLAGTRRSDHDEEWAGGFHVSMILRGAAFYAEKASLAG